MALNTVRGVVNFGPRLTKKIAAKVKRIPHKVAEETSPVLSLLKKKAQEAKDITATTISKVKTIPKKLKESLNEIKVVEYPQLYQAVPNDHYFSESGEGYRPIPYQGTNSFDFLRNIPEQNSGNIRMIEQRLKQEFEKVQHAISPEVVAENMENLKENIDHFSRRIPGQAIHNVRTITVPPGLKPIGRNAEKIQQKLQQKLQHRLLEDAKNVGRMSDKISQADGIPLKKNLASTEALLRTIPDQMTEDLGNMRNIPHHLRQNLESYKSIPYNFAKNLESMKSIPHLFWSRLGRSDLANSGQGITQDKTHKKKELTLSEDDRKMGEYFKKIIYAYLVDQDA